MKTTDSDPIIGTRIREYEILEVLGKGGMGAVYRARHVVLQEERAIKVIQGRLAQDRLLVERFVREARILTKLHHPNLVQLYEFGDLEPEGSFMVMELIRGPSVLDLLRQRGRFAPGDAVRIARQAALGLQSAHEKGIVHRDIAPDNLLIVTDADGSETVKVIDFGIAKPLFELQSGAVTDVFIGKTEYCSPEQCGLLEEGEIIDRRSDIYSLGVTLYQMLSGRLPFSAPTPQGYLVKHVSETPPPLSSHFPEGDLPPELNRIVMKMMARRREDRHATMAEVIRELEALTPGEMPAAVSANSTGASAPLQIGDLFARRYLIEKEVGRGGMGTVYRARDTFLDTPVALKVLAPALSSDGRMLERLKREVLLARKIHHPNVCRIYDFGEHSGVHFISMEYLEGRTLADILDKDGLLSPQVGLPILRQVLLALNEVHRNGIIHRDLKPENIMVDGAGKATLMDFGISVSDRSRPITQAGATAGTQAYMAPERSAHGENDPRSDVYSMGVILFETLTGSLPGEQHRATALNPGLPPQLDPVIEKALAGEPEHRYQRMQDLLEELTPLIPSGTSVVHAGLPAGLRRGFTILAAMLLLLIVYAAARMITHPLSTQSAAVIINALPWARVRLTPEGSGLKQGSAGAVESTTPCTLQVPPGRYLLELSNDGLSNPLQQHITVAPEGAGPLVFTMPGFDPRATAAEALSEP